jgi:hypothetical protein
MSPKQLRIAMISSKNFGEIGSRGEEKGNSVSDSKNDMPRVNPVQAGPDAPTGAKKVRSSRYEWESKSGENEHNPHAAGTSLSQRSISQRSSSQRSSSQRSLLASLGALIKRFFFGGRDMFDNDDDPSPSAA